MNNVILFTVVISLYKCHILPPSIKEMTLFITWSRDLLFSILVFLLQFVSRIEKNAINYPRASRKNVSLFFIALIIIIYCSLVFKFESCCNGCYARNVVKLQYILWTDLRKPSLHFHLWYLCFLWLREYVL